MPCVACARVILMKLVLTKAYAFKIKASMPCIMTSNQYQDSLELTLCLVVFFSSLESSWADIDGTAVLKAF